VPFELGPHPQRAFVRADPRTKLDALGGEEAPLEFTVVGNVEVGSLETIDRLAERRRIRNILVDNVMHGRGTWRDRLGRSHQRVHGIRDPPPRTMPTLAISMIVSAIGSVPVV
jgi:hypothetical protein